MAASMFHSSPTNVSQMDLMFCLCAFLTPTLNSPRPPRDTRSKVHQRFDHRLNSKIPSDISPTSPLHFTGGQKLQNFWHQSPLMDCHFEKRQLIGHLKQTQVLAHQQEHFGVFVLWFTKYISKFKIEAKTTCVQMYTWIFWFYVLKAI